MRKTPRIVELAIFIKNLLYNHDIVIIPGFGALVTNYKPAEINPSDRTISPPGKFLVFDIEKNQSDDLLADEIALYKNISKDDAKRLIKKDVNELVTRLNQGETVLLEGLGYFSKERDTIRFEKEKEANFLTDSYGLTKVDYEPVEIQIIPREDVESTVTEVKKRSYIPFVLMFIFLVLVAAGISVYTFYPKVIQKYFPKLHHSIVAQNKPDTATSKVTETKDTIKKEPQLERFFDSTTNKKNALAIQQPKPIEKEHAVDRTITYYIIGGSFTTFDKAKIFANKLIKEGDSAQIIQFDPEVFRISMGAYHDRSVALQKMGEILQKRGKGSVWLLKKSDSVKY